MARGYTFFERRRGLDFWALEDAIDECRRTPIRDAILTYFPIWGKFDDLVVLQGADVDAIHKAIIEVYLQASRDDEGTCISDSCTFVAVNAPPVQTWPSRATVLAIDTELGKEHQVRNKLLTTHGVLSADVVLGDHDVIALIDAELSQNDEYRRFIGDTVDKIRGIHKTHTMFSFARPETRLRSNDRAARGTP